MEPEEEPDVDEEPLADDAWTFAILLPNRGSNLYFTCFYDDDVV